MGVEARRDRPGPIVGLAEAGQGHQPDRPLRIGLADALDGGSGDDDIDGGAGNDLLTWASGRDQIIGGDGADEIIGGTGDDILSDGPQADTFTDIYRFEAGDGHDRIDGPISGD